MGIYYHLDDYYKSVTPNPFLVKVSEEIKPGYALDIGAGNGRNSLYLRSKGWKVICIDINETAISLCKEAGLEARRMDICDVKAFRGGPFDLIMCLYVYQHLDIRQQTITTKRIWNNISAHGWFIFGGFLDERKLLCPSILFPATIATVKYKHIWQEEDRIHGELHMHRGVIVAAQRKAPEDDRHTII